MIKRTLLTALLAALVSATPVVAQAQIIVRIAPPEPRVMVIPEPRRGYVWVPGYWNWQNKRHVWVNGQWLRDRKGYAYHQPRWKEDNGSWQLERGRWSRGDRDGDGVPNSRDRAPDNPRRQ